MTTCKNCGVTFEGKYCNQCRQESTIARITWSEVLRQLRHATMDVDRGFFFTVHQLFFRPGATIRDYLEGKRVNYTNPFFYVLLLAGFGSLLFLSFDVPLPVRSVNLDTIERMSPLVAQKYFILVGLVIMTMLTVGDRLLHFKAGYNLAEITVANTFQAGQLMVITILSFPLIYLQDRYFPTSNFWLDVRQLLKLAIFVYLVLVRQRLYLVQGRSLSLHRLTLLGQIMVTIAIYELLISKLVLKIM
jgi:Protein of unknown function (DUF3667)